ncbi:hypothetical protein ACFL2J_01160 [Candidatus Omnitrophota bacterium]
MGRNKDKTVRKLTKIGKDSYCVTLPIEIIRRFGWREKQKLRLEIDSEKRQFKVKGWKP